MTINRTIVLRSYHLQRTTFYKKINKISNYLERRLHSGQVLSFAASGIKEYYLFNINNIVLYLDGHERRKYKILFTKPIRMSYETTQARRMHAGRNHPERFRTTPSARAHARHSRSKGPHGSPLPRISWWRGKFPWFHAGESQFLKGFRVV